jgi:hypothetical protein
MKRFKAAKGAGHGYLGFKNFDRACEKLLNYSSQQVRRIAAGQPTPPKKKIVNHLTPAAKKAREINANVKEATAASEEVKQVSNLESQALMNVTHQEATPYGDILLAADKLARACLTDDVIEIRHLAKVYLAMRPTVTQAQVVIHDPVKKNKGFNNFEGKGQVGITIVFEEEFDVITKMTRASSVHA